MLVRVSLNNLRANKYSRPAHEGFGFESQQRKLCLAGTRHKAVKLKVTGPRGGCANALYQV
ncbi:hypothetical protein J6590_035704 [Homalodisca vitripennis]|nr:hypothetical protein J6590_035704 [Homalodisca vitripennis]